MAGTSRQKHVLLSILIVTIYPSKDSEKYIADDKAVRSNIKYVWQCIFHCPKHDRGIGKGGGKHLILYIAIIPFNFQTTMTDW